MFYQVKLINSRGASCVGAYTKNIAFQMTFEARAHLATFAIVALSRPSQFVVQIWSREQAVSFNDGLHLVLSRVNLLRLHFAVRVRLKIDQSR